MKGGRSRGYKSYGPIPQNEYTMENLVRSEDTAAVLDCDPKPVGTAHRLRLVKRQALHPSGRRKTSGWVLSWKANGWRAESASLPDESTARGRRFSYVQKNSRPT